MKNSVFALLPIICLLISPFFASGDELTIEVSLVATGSLGNINFTNEMVTITGIGDTENVMVNGDVNLLLDGLEVTVDIANVGTAVFTDAIQAVSNNNSDLGGFGNTSNQFGLILVFNDAFSSYNLLTDLPPVSGFGVIVIGVAHQTDQGSFRFFDVTGDGTISATVSPDCKFEAGDANQDGNVNLLDVGPFVDALFTDFFVCEADTNQDGTVDLLDVNPFVAILAGN